MILDYLGGPQIIWKGGKEVSGGIGGMMMEAEGEKAI